jgi:hypothetical protein
LLKEILFLPLLFNFTLEYAIRKDQENQNGLELNKTHQTLLYADDIMINLLDKNKYHIESIETLLDASTEVGLKMKVKKTKYIFMPHHQKAGQTANTSFDNVAELE